MSRLIQAVVTVSPLPGKIDCCAQQTGMHRLVVEALLIAIFLSEGRANTWRHEKTLSVENLSRAIWLVPAQLCLSSWFLSS